MVKNRKQMAVRKNPYFVGVIAVLALVVIVGVITIRSRTPATETAYQPSGSPPSTSSTANLPAAPDFEVVMYQGEALAGGSKVRLSQLWAKGKPVVLNYWAGLCPPCRAEMPDFQKFYAGGGKEKITLIGVDIGPFIGLGSREDAKALLRELNISYPAGTTFDENTVNAYQILGMPTTVFITPNGKIFRKYTGLLTRDQLNAFVADLLKASGNL